MSLEGLRHRNWQQPTLEWLVVSGNCGLIGSPFPSLRHPRALNSCSSTRRRSALVSQ